jgi:hypothetical protein
MCLNDFFELPTTNREEPKDVGALNITEYRNAIMEMCGYI